MGRSQLEAAVIGCFASVTAECTLRKGFCGRAFPGCFWPDVLFPEGQGTTLSYSFHSIPLLVLNSKEQTPVCIVIFHWRISEAIPTIAYEFRTGQTPALHSDMSVATRVPQLAVVLTMVRVFLLLSCLSEEWFLSHLADTPSILTGMVGTLSINNRHQRGLFTSN